MKPESQRPKGREGATGALNAAIKDTDLAGKASRIAPARIAFGSTSTLLTLIRDSTANGPDCVELGLLCVDVCRALDKGTNGKGPDEFSQPVYDAINQLSMTVADIQKKLVKWGERNAVSRRFHARKDKETIAAWRSSLEKILQILNKVLATDTDAAVSTVRHDTTNTHTTVPSVQNVAAKTSAVASDSHRNVLKRPEDSRSQNLMTHASAPGESSHPSPGSAHGTVSDIRRDFRAIVSELERNTTSTRTMVSEIHRTVMKDQGVDGNSNLLTRTSVPGESPPLPPRTFFGRDELIEKIVDLTQNLTPIALIGAGGIGKTSIALTILHHDRIKERFGHDRRFIRCDKFPPSCAHLLQRLSNVIGAGVENPEDLTPLRTFLSSKEMLIVLDNAESILDPQGIDAQEIYGVVEELSQFNNICICITSRISTIPPDYKRLDVPTLSIDAARQTFHRIYDGDIDRTNVVNRILEQLDFHPLSITLLATVAHQNRWGMDRLTREWERRRTDVLQTQHNKSLAATIELSLASPLFQELGPEARALLGIVAFFPQGVDEDNLEWLFPTLSNRTDVFDKFCILSLAYRSDGFVTMLAPLRDYLSPRDPRASTLLCTAKEHYFTRMSAEIDPNNPNFEETQWITSEDVNVEHLLDVFTTVDANSDDVWLACIYFMAHLRWHKGRPTILKSKIEGLPDDHRSKPECLFQLSRLFSLVGICAECKRLLVHALNLSRERGDDYWVAITLEELSNANQLIGLYEEGMEQAKEASEIFEQLGETAEQAQCLISLAWALCDDGQFDAAEEAASRAINLLPEDGEQFRVCESHRALGRVYQSKGDTEKAIHHYEVALEIASPFDWPDSLFWLNYDLAGLSYDEDTFDDAHTYIEHAKSHTANSVYNLGRVTKLQAMVWYGQHRLEEAESEALRAADIFDELEAVEDMEHCRMLLRNIEKKLNTPAASGQSDLDCNRTIASTSS